MTEVARETIRNGENRLFLSAASVWEMAIKVRIGKLAIREPIEQFIPEQMRLNAIDTLPIQLSHALRVSTLPDHHKDPFDRMLVAQSQMENMPIVTSDPLIARYGVATIW
jgi:PIN domain nuclease of toxin-antitoxin system